VTVVGVDPKIQARRAWARAARPAAAELRQPPPKNIGILPRTANVCFQQRVRTAFNYAVERLDVVGMNVGKNVTVAKTADHQEFYPVRRMSQTVR
jgi:hypothetical protein